MDIQTKNLAKFNSYKEAEVMAKMLELENYRIDKIQGKFIIVQCTKYMDTNGVHLKVGDTVQRIKGARYRILDIIYKEVDHTTEIKLLTHSNKKHTIYIYKTNYFRINGYYFNRVSIKDFAKYLSNKIAANKIKYIKGVFIIFLTITVFLFSFCSMIQVVLN